MQKTSQKRLVANQIEVDPACDCKTQRNSFLVYIKEIKCSLPLAHRSTGLANQNNRSGWLSFERFTMERMHRR